MEVQFKIYAKYWVAHVGKTERESASQPRNISLVLAHATVVHSPTDSSQIFSTLPEDRRWQIVMKALNPTVLTLLICLYLLQFVLVVGTLAVINCPNSNN